VCMPEAVHKGRARGPYSRDLRPGAFTRPRRR